MAALPSFLRAGSAATPAVRSANVSVINYSRSVATRAAPLTQTRGTIFLNGEWCTPADAKLSVFDVSVLRGFGVFDFMRTFGGRPFHLDAHLKRLTNSARQVDLDMHWTEDELRGIVADTLAKDYRDNPSTSDGTGEERFVRLVVTGGVTSDWMSPADKSTLAVMITPCQVPPVTCYEDGISVMSFLHERWMTEAKTCNYLPAMSKLRAIRAAGAFEGVYTDRSDRVLEGLTSNLFFVTKDGVVVSAAEGILPGITRAGVIDTIRHAGVPLELREVFLREVPEFQEAFITASNKMIMPVVKFDDLTIGNGKPGPVTKMLMGEFAEVTERWADGEQV